MLCTRRLALVILLIPAAALAQGKVNVPNPCFSARSDQPDAVIAHCSTFLSRQDKSKTLYERALNRRGLAYYRTNRHREALADFNALIVSNPTGAGYLDNRRAVYFALGQLDNALSDANAAVRNAPTRAFVYHGRGVVHFDLGRYEAAAKDFTTAFELPEKDPFLFSLYDRGRTQMRLRRFEQAVIDFTKVFQSDPNFAYALRERAIALIELGRLEAAQRDLLAFLQREPNDAEALAALSRLRGHPSTGAPSPGHGSSDALAAKQPIPIGTAFYVSDDARLLTNAHVIKGCTALSVSQPGMSRPVPVQILATDAANDLALLHAPGSRPNTIPPFRRQVRLGEDVSVFGFPLSGLIASTGNFTRGNVTALAGIRDDTTHMQLSVPIQPGNSGGPVLDQSGAIVGIVIGKLDAMLMAKATGTIPEQINFAIKANTALSFLEANGLNVTEAPKVTAAMAPPDLADHARKFTVLVRCARG